MAVDNFIFFSIHGLAHRWLILDAIGIFFAAYALYVLGIGALFTVWQSRKDHYYLFGSVVVAYILNFIIGHVWFRARPFVELSLQPLIYHPATKSFPSDHTTIAFALATIIAMSMPQYRVLAYTWALAIGLARIFVGVHFPADVLAGAIIGTSMPFIIVYIYRYIRMNRTYGQCH